MRKRKVGLLTFSDGRKFAHELQREMNLEFHNRFRARLESSGEYEVVAGEEIVWHPEVAKREGSACFKRAWKRRSSIMPSGAFRTSP